LTSVGLITRIVAGVGGATGAAVVDGRENALTRQRVACALVTSIRRLARHVGAEVLARAVHANADGAVPILHAGRGDGELPRVVEMRVVREAAKKNDFAARAVEGERGITPRTG